MSTTHSIKIAFSVDAGVDAGRLMDDLIQHITGIRGTRDLKASHKREVTQWWTNPVTDPLSRPPLERQQAFEWEPERELTEKDRRILAEEAFPTAPEDHFEWGQEQSEEEYPYQLLTLNERVYQHGEDPMEIMGDDDRLTGTGKSQFSTYPPNAYATKHKRCLLLHVEKTVPIKFMNDNRPFAYWNDTLQAYIVRPTPENVIELCEQLEEENQEDDDDYSEERVDEDYDY